MVVKVINGMRIHEPPYTQAEGLLLRAQLVTVQSRRPQNSGSRHRQNRTALKSLLEPVDPALPLADNPARVLDVLVRRADRAASAELFDCCRAKWILSPFRLSQIPDVITWLAWS